ncbi:MAG: alpha/beta hydrolase [Balneolaceae bacterium]
MNNRFKVVCSGSFLTLLFISSCTPASPDRVKKIIVEGIELHYTIEGRGESLILIHGSLADLRYWKDQTPFLKDHFQVIAYSRRYNYPNTNNTEPDHSAIVEAQDLLKLMNELNIDQAHILGHSYGAYTALWFALEHPEKVSSLILAEPPLMKWLPDIPGGEGVEGRFMANIWQPIGDAFLESGESGGLEFTAQWYFDAPFDSISEEWKTFLTDNAKEWQALAVSADAFPMVDYKKVKILNIPTLLLSGSRNSGNMNDLIDGHLAKLIPDNQRIIIEDAGHEMFMDNVEGSNKAILSYIKKE